LQLYLQRKYRRQLFIFDAHMAACFSKQVLLSMSKQDDWLFRMIDDFVGEVMLVVENQRDIILTGNVFRRNDGEFVPRNGVRTACGSGPLTFDSGPSAFERDALDPTTRDRTTHGHAMQHAFEF